MKSSVFDFLKRFEQNNLVSSNGQDPITYGAFSHLVNKIEDQVHKLIDHEKKSQVLVGVEDPALFFATIFALHNLSHQAIFPTRSFFLDGYIPKYVSHILTENNASIEIKENSHFEVELAKGIDPRTDVIVYSSGSTGNPKGICHPMEHFFKNASELGKMVTYGDSITPLKPYLLSTFAHFVSHLIEGNCLHFYEYNKNETLKFLYEQNPSLGYVGSPVHLISSLKAIPISSNPKYFFSSGDFIYYSTINQFFEYFPSSVFYKVYGLAELAGRFFVNKMTKGVSQVEANCAGENLPSTEYRVVDKEIQVNAAFKFLNYVSDEKAWRPQEYHETNDLVDKIEDKLTLIGRKTDEIKVGGQKVILREIESKILESQLLKSIALIAIPHHIFGNLIGLVVQSDQILTKKDLQQNLSRILAKNEIPHYYYQVEEFPVTQTFKIDRKKILSNLDELQEII